MSLSELRLSKFLVFVVCESTAPILNLMSMFGEHGFHLACLDARNSLPSHLHCITDAHILFKCKVKTERSGQAFYC